MLDCDRFRSQVKMHIAGQYRAALEPFTFGRITAPPSQRVNRFPTRLDEWVADKLRIVILVPSQHCAPFAS